MHYAFKFVIVCLDKCADYILISWSSVSLIYLIRIILAWGRAGCFVAYVFRLLPFTVRLVAALDSATNRGICCVSLRPPPLLVVFLSSDMACHWLWSPSNSNSRNSLVRLRFFVQDLSSICPFSCAFSWGWGGLCIAVVSVEILLFVCAPCHLNCIYETRLFQFFTRLPRACTCILPDNQPAMSWYPIYVCTLQSRACYHLLTSQRMSACSVKLCSVWVSGWELCCCSWLKRRSCGMVLVRRLVQASLSVVCRRRPASDFRRCPRCGCSQSAG